MFDGTIFFLWSASSTDWPEHHTLWSVLEVASGSVTLWLDPEQKITAVFKPETGPPYSVTSCQVILEAKADLSVAVTWKGNEGNIYLEGQLAGTSKPDTKTADQITARRRNFFQAGEAYGERNEECRLKRHREVSQLAPKKHRRPIGPSEELDQLKAAVRQLSQLTSAVSVGHSHFDTALADRLRALICHFKSSQAYPLLQRVAGRYALPLNVHALPFDGLDRDHWATTDMGLSILGPVSIEQIRPEYAAMDIDIWLELQHVSVKGEDYSNNAVIRAVADTEGSHYDTGAEPVVDALRSLRFNPPHVTRINSMLIEIARVVLAL